MASDAPTFISNGAGESPSATAVLDVVFVHGLSGNRYQTWSDTEDCFWLKWLAEEFPTCNFYTAGYDTEIFYSRLTGPGASFQDLATTLADGIASRTSPAPRILLVTHSLGGLIVKQMVRRCSDSANSDFNGLARSVQGVVFFGTPHQGAALSTALDTLLANFKSKAVKQLAYGNDTLIDLHEFFRNWATKHSVLIRSYYETEQTIGVHIVDMVSANPHVFGADPIAVQADHTGICKPKTKAAYVYKSMVAFIKTVIQGRSIHDGVGQTGKALVPVVTSNSHPVLAPSRPELGRETLPALIERSASPLLLPAATPPPLGTTLPDGLAPDILSDYQFYTETAEADRRDLAVKLRATGRSYQVRDAEQKKERFNMALRRHIAQPAAMTRYTKLMADVETRFHRHVDRLTSSGADIASIDHAIQTEVIDPCTTIHSTEGHEISASLVDSAIYYLAGNCHIRWDNGSN